ncbi:nicotinate-nucleotide adenylyltransferase [Elioraea sp. Yellowstone]|uniref:nicotinate-nucleotide adenylyltransferase n=1 Tax=Elioraea sp. Yellowstone TaxID=2592070 RepID=UPI00192A49CB|nr:nicotinate-nucleotide adenylyltransferase [Elioraea sp. Yellowstone]
MPAAISHWGDGRRGRIGILGGSFNPAHEGHRHIAETALKRLGLKAVWLLVSPGNPLKPVDGMAPFADRLASAARIATGNARILPTDLEARLGTRYTVQTLALLTRRFPRARLVWLMGADNQVQIPRWQGWRRIFAMVPIVVFPRPGWTRKALHGRATRAMAASRLPHSRAAALPDMAPPAWLLLPGREHPASATQIRAARAADAAAAGGKRRRLPARRAQADDVERLVRLIVTSLENDKADEIVVIDLAGKASFADRMVVASGLAGRQLTAMAEHLIETLERDGVRNIRTEGLGASDWVLIDAGDVVVHLFRPEARAHYALEKMWGMTLPGDEARFA